MSNTNDANRIEQLSAAILETAVVTPPPSDRPHLEELEIQEDVMVNALADKGVTRDQLKAVTTGITELTRAAHHAATRHNIGRIKAAVSDKKDPTGFVTQASGTIGRSLKIMAESRAVREGEMTQKDGVKKPYQSFGSGRGQAIIGGGLGSAMSAQLAEEVKEAFKGCDFITIKK